MLSAPPPELPSGDGASAPPTRLVLIGYSYGSCVAAQALARVPEVGLGLLHGLLRRLAPPYLLAGLPLCPAA